jgi:hypothetical protein
MNINYPVADFFRHQELWNTKYNAVPQVTLMNATIDLSKASSTEAMALRVRSMMSSEGIPEPLDGKWSKIFSFVQMYLAEHVDALFKAGLVRLHDGSQSVVTPQALVAIQEAFLPDPPPMPAAVSIASIITRAREIEKEHDAG